MNNDIFFGQNSLRFWYYRFKDSPYFSLSIASIIIVACLFLFFQIIIPQVQNWFSIRNEIDATSQRIDVLKSNINFMSNLDKTQLSSDVNTASSALPPEKDFGGILNAIAASAVKAGVSLQDYSFQVGSISSNSALTKFETTKDGFSTVRVTVAIMGTLDGTKNFLQEIAQKLPLSQVTTVGIENQTTSIDIDFYQKPFPKIAFQDEQPLTPVSDKNRLILQKLSQWKNSSNGIEKGLGQIPASAGAMPLF